ncbi:hypothetical protein [Desulfovibrio litoralis]|uniref:Phosphohydrolase n=1 Tax=Desulfovibrio litoralis DSM 11393 TaxID=1121455 RepID=A0A1M7SB90_9BACT|nr:hypothetical protein [Desulfovibrio litoralis]SHN55797.1 hypothetical protein SAMN02745728_00720 [Desulfovibrio litoralis DSM 11393]
MNSERDYSTAVPKHGSVITFSGKMFSLLNPKPEDINIQDIAHSLANSCRWGGHCRSFFSVAEHSVLVSSLVPKEYALWGLLHDAGEAYLVDVPRPVKLLLNDYQAMEKKVMKAVCLRFKLDLQEPEIVKNADSRLLADEAHQLGMYPELWGDNLLEPWGINLDLLPPASAKERFLNRYTEIIRQNG